jgi:hypothetical protein
MHRTSPPAARLREQRCRLFIRQGWTYVQSIDRGARALQTVVDPEAAMTWPEPQAMRIGADLCARHRITVELRPVEATTGSSDAGRR